MSRLPAKLPNTKAMYTITSAPSALSRFFPTGHGVSRGASDVFSRARSFITRTTVRTSTATIQTFVPARASVRGLVLPASVNPRKEMPLVSASATVRSSPIPMRSPRDSLATADESADFSVDVMAGNLPADPVDPRPGPLAAPPVPGRPRQEALVSHSSLAELLDELMLDRIRSFSAESVDQSRRVGDDDDLGTLRCRCDQPRQRSGELGVQTRLRLVEDQQGRRPGAEQSRRHRHVPESPVAELGHAHRSP